MSNMGNQQMEMARLRASARRQESALGACIITWEMLRRLGYEADQLFFTSDASIVGMSLFVPNEKPQKDESFKQAFDRAGGKQINFACGAREPGLVAQDLSKMWSDFADKWNRANDIYRAQLFAQHASIERTLSILIHLVSEKVAIPNPSVSGIAGRLSVTPKAIA